MKYSFLAVILITSLSLNAQNNYWQQQTNYNIAVTLNDREHSIDGYEKITYTNNSPDTLKFIWLHVWMNAYKNDKTAFSEQLLKNGRTDFYFSNEAERGYTSKLDFKVDDTKAIYQTDSINIDIIKLILPKPLAPKQTAIIETPFYSKLPYNFSRGGHIANDYQLTQWYVKPAVYDKYGWHQMPYLEQGEFYSEFGNFEVNITVPKEYIIAATGELQNADELAVLKKLGKTKPEMQSNFLSSEVIESTKNTTNKSKTQQQIAAAEKQLDNRPTKTLTYTQNTVHDFAWFASKNFLVQYDTVSINNKVVDCFNFFPVNRFKQCKDNIFSIKNTLKKYSNWVGEYPYNTATVVVGKQNKIDGMEYPTITYINVDESSNAMNEIISHELGHNWFYGILASNEREHPWMDEGMNTYYDERKNEQNKITDESQIPKEFKMKMAKAFDARNVMYNTFIGIHKNIPIDTNAIAYPSMYYGAFVYEKAAYWLQLLEKQVGRNVFDSLMKIYYNNWKFKHPYPQDFKAIAEQVSGKIIDEHFAKLYNNNLLIAESKKPFKVGFGLPTTNASKFNNLSITPTVSYNYYDGIRLGAAIYNHKLPLPKFQFVFNPCYGTSSKTFNFFGRVSYNIYRKNYWLELSTSYQNYSYSNFKVVDTNNVVEFDKNILLQRIVPHIKLTLYNKDLRSTERTVIGFKTFYLNKQDYNYTTKNNNFMFNTKSYVNRLYIDKFDNRILFPYSLNFTADQTEDLLRLSFTAKQFFNYGKSNEGINARFFAGKIIYLKQKNTTVQYTNYNYWFNLIATNGQDDYTYSDYFIGRNEQQRGWKGQQIMERDGFLKTRMDYVTPIGKTDDWLMAVNVSADMPTFPAIKFYFDLGTYAEAWKNNDANGRFLFTSGVQLNLLKNMVSVYIPVLQSRVFRDYNDLYLQDKKFLKTISFNINLQNLKLNKLSRDIPL